jgi:alkylhydroperoxidase family enzyme
MDPRRYELVTVAAAQRLRSSYCSLAHGKVLVDQFFDASEVCDVMVDHHAAGLMEVDVAVMDLAEKIVEDATSITESEINHLRDLGLSDTDIFEVVVATSARCFFSKTLDALGAQADVSFSALEPRLKEALTVGRPIADG